MICVLMNKSTSKQDEHDDELKVKLDTTSESETKQAESVYEEIHILRENLAEKLSLLEEMKNQLENSKSSESLAHAFASETLLQLETAKKAMESLKLNSDEYNAILLELDQSRARVSSLEGIINKMKTADHKSESEELIAMKSGQTLEITAELKKSKLDIEELKANLMDKETELQCIREENEDLRTKLANLIADEQENELDHESKQDINGLKSKLTSLETEINEKTDENEKLKLEIKKMNGLMESSKQDFNILKSKLTNLETELQEKSDENEKLKLEFKKINAVMEASKQDFNGLKSKLKEKSDENENLKLEIKKTDGMNEEIKKSMNDQLESVKTSNGEMEEELKRLKMQMSQWRKAAEAATAMLCDENSDNNGRMVVDRTWSMDHYSPIKRVNISSPCNLDIDDDNDDDEEFSKRKNGNVLKRIGVLWKKPQNK